MAETGPDETGDDPQHEDADLKKNQPVMEFFEELKEGPSKIKEWFREITKKPPRFDAFLANPQLNRYPNAVLYDSTRVKLKPNKPDTTSDYIHASWVDSFEKRKGYILSQAPYDSETEFDFWRMVSQTKPSLIVVLTNIKKGDTNFIRQFWPNQQELKDFGFIRIKCEDFDEARDHDRFDLTVELHDKTVSSPPLLAYSAWEEDKTLPANLLEFRATMKIALRKVEARPKPPSLDAPVLLVCPSGVHRAGTFAGLDIVLDRISAERKVGLAETVSILRTQRFGVFSMFQHYQTVADIIVRHAVSCNIVNPDALLGKMA
ncbi:hypothetical protein PRIPAC_77520 [Pristionchus pacificus]|uniref:Tyrosine phosphatase n=1 Tax=Pristionchus pacificus TaxID=54126 RepID=A0A454Y3M0_PRIPA|nr:hypothetical protein PRIPAC_77520 [Pristionchus pacificus]|eukprot:PDM72838.1 tyrosine phosphatase [Pristionchus pacificus]